MPTTYLNHYRDHLERQNEYLAIESNLGTIKQNLITIGGNAGNAATKSQVEAIAAQIPNLAKGNDVAILIGGVRTDIGNVGNKANDNFAAIMNKLNALSAQISNISSGNGGSGGGGTIVANVFDTISGSPYSNGHGTKWVWTASSVYNGSVAWLTDKSDSDFYTDNIANSWVSCDLGYNISTRKVSLTGMTLKNRNNSAHFPVSIILEGSNDGSSFTTIYSWSNIGFTAANETRTVNFSASPAYRYIRIRSVAANSSGGNFLCLGEVEFIGSVV